MEELAKELIRPKAGIDSYHALIYTAENRIGNQTRPTKRTRTNTSRTTFIYSYAHHINARHQDTSAEANYNIFPLSNHVYKQISSF